MLRADSPIEDACRPRRWRIALAVVAGALLGLAFALVMPARYEAGAELLVDAGEDPALAAARMDSLMRIAASGRVIDRLVAELGLADDPEFARRPFDPVRRLRTRETDAKSLAAHALVDRLTISRPGQAFVVSISARSESAGKAARIANRLAGILIEESGALLRPAPGGDRLRLTVLSEARPPVFPAGPGPLTGLGAGGALGLLAALAAWRPARTGAAPAQGRRRWRRARGQAPAAGRLRPGSLAAIREDLREIRGALNDIAELRRR